MDKEMSASVAKHSAEFCRDFAANRYERTAGGLFFPRSRVRFEGVYHSSRDGGKTWDIAPNTVTEEGRKHLLEVGLAGALGNRQWYLALYSNDYSAKGDTSLTAATFPVTAGEIVSASEGYSNPTRRPWTPDAISTSMLVNQAAPAVFDMKTAGSVQVWGAALLSEQAKGATTGICLSCAKFKVAKTFEDGEEFTLRYKIIAIEA